jgi:enterochelin esterase family protein
MFNLNRGVPLSFEDPGGFDAGYVPHPESLQLYDGAPQGKIIEHKDWSQSSVYPGTTRDWYVYVPAQYDPGTPAALWVGMDAFGSSQEGRTTLDNLIFKGDMPVTIGVFVMPGRNPDNAEQRSLEYDTVSDVYASFLENDILPLVSAEYNISNDPQLRMAAGGSSGGICAFTLAFLRPDLFGKVLCFIGSFVNIRGGHNLSWLVRNNQRRPITVYLADGEHDLNNQHGSWPIANREMYSALSYAGYACHLEWGKGCHSGRHIASVLPDALRWLWSTPSNPEGASVATAPRL